VDGGDASWKRPDQSTWSESSARAVLQLMVESVAELVGFEVAALSVVIGDELMTLAYTGPEEHREYLEESDPVSVIEPLLARATSWGPRLRFLEGMPLAELEGHWVQIEQVPTDHPDAWRPDDGLLAVLSNDGAVVGILSVDRPSSGRRPDERQCSLLERYAAQAERAVLTLFERQALLEQVAHAESARHLIRSASRPTHGSLEDVLRLTHGQLVASFDARGSWLHVFQPDGPGVCVVRTHTGQQVEIAPDVIDLVGQAASDLWVEQRPLVLTGDDLRERLPPAIRRQLAHRDVSWLLGVALGVGEECVGFMALWRHADQSGWSPVEIASAQQIGHDLGAALMTARALERERNLVSELHQIDDYRSQLVAMLSHELRTPLTVISGNLELLGDTDLDAQAKRYHAAMGRGTERMQMVVDDLLLLARVSNPNHPLVRLPVDLRSVMREVVSLVESTARSKGVTLTVDLDPAPLVVPGDAVELDRLVGNLVSNAVKYTGSGGTVVVNAARRHGEVVLAVADTGLGISEHDQQGLFRAFFRTTNPEALREPGTGLGLAAVATIVERHQGRVEVCSRLGEGSTFTVTLPTVS
jgi:signal transduction histidine kinase